MKYIEHVVTGEIFRVEDNDAKKHVVDKNFRYVSKGKYKDSERQRILKTMRGSK